MKKRPRSKPSARPVPKSEPAPTGLAAHFTHLPERLFQPTDALPLGIFRFLFGFLLCLEFFVVSWKTFPSIYLEPAFHFTYPLFDLLGLRPLSQPSLWIVFDVLKVSAVAVTLGLLTRIALIVFTATFGYFFFMESSVYSNHYYLIFLLAFLLCLGHSGAAFSLDCLFRKRARREQVAYWEFFLLRFQICVVFFFGALAKLNADWLIQAAPLYLNFIKHFSVFGYPLQEKWMAVTLSWGGMLSDLGLGILLVANRWPKVTFIWLCLFNGLNVFFFGLGIKTFPYLMVSAYILFLPPARVREFFSSLFSKNLPQLEET